MRRTGLWLAAFLACLVFADQASAGGPGGPFRRVWERRKAELGAELSAELSSKLEGDVKVVVDSVYPLEKFGEAFSKLESGHATGKIVLKLRDEQPAAQP